MSIKIGTYSQGFKNANHFLSWFYTYSVTSESDGYLDIKTDNRDKSTLVFCEVNGKSIIAFFFDDGKCQYYEKVVDGISDIVQLVKSDLED